MSCDRALAAADAEEAPVGFFLPLNTWYMLGLSPFWWPEKPPELPEEVENRWSSEFADNFVLVPVVDGVATDSDGDSGVACDDEDAGGEEAANHSCRTASSGVSRLTGSHLRIRKRIPLINFFVFFSSKGCNNGEMRNQQIRRPFHKNRRRLTGLTCHQLRAL